LVRVEYIEPRVVDTAESDCNCLCLRDADARCLLYDLHDFQSDARRFDRPIPHLVRDHERARRHLQKSSASSKYNMCSAPPITTGSSNLTAAAACLTRDVITPNQTGNTHARGVLLPGAGYVPLATATTKLWCQYT
jgi:hypothetical protein